MSLHKDPVKGLGTEKPRPHNNEIGCRTAGVRNIPYLAGFGFRVGGSGLVQRSGLTFGIRGSGLDP